METHLEIIEELIESDKATLTAVDKMFLGSVLWLIVFLSTTCLLIERFAHTL